jgi:hypothetical protein
MQQTESQPRHFLGTYFDRDAVLRVARWGEILAWVVVGVYAFDLLLALGIFLLQVLRGFMQGMGFSDLLMNIVLIVERPFRGVVYFLALQGISKALLILMDMEESMRRAAGK